MTMLLLTESAVHSQCFPLSLWTEVQPVHTPVRSQAYGPALSQSNFSILSVFCLVYNNAKYVKDTAVTDFRCLVTAVYNK